jgi:hypothetical protein
VRMNRFIAKEPIKPQMAPKMITVKLLIVYKHTTLAQLIDG